MGSSGAHPGEGGAGAGPYRPAFGRGGRPHCIRLDPVDLAELVDLLRFPRARLSISGEPFVAGVGTGTAGVTNEEMITMAQYLLSVWHDEDYDVDMDGEDMQRIQPKVSAVNEEMMATGAWVFAGGLHGAGSATVVQAKGDDISMTDGPYAESKELMGGFWILELPDLDAALEWARKATVACELPVEVRPFHGEG